MKTTPIDVSRKVCVIGGGAAGFFAAINIAIKHPEYRVEILEKSQKLLAKVKVSGGGRCNITHACFDRKELVKHYPRGEKELQQVFARFDTSDTINWFAEQGLLMHTEADGRMFPRSNNSQEVIDCFMRLARKYRVQIETGCELQHIRTLGPGFELKTSSSNKHCDLLVCAMGGHPKSGFYDVIRRLGHSIIEPLPSLFTFNLPAEPLCKTLQGVSVPMAEVRIAESVFKQQGPLLITHWGLSGPAVLKLSAFGAKEMAKRNYQSRILVNWLHPLSFQEAEERLKETKSTKGKALPQNQLPFALPKRLWEFLCRKAGWQSHKPWAEMAGKDLSALARILTTDDYEVKGKTTFKEEFVTCGGIDLKEVDLKSMQSKRIPGLFFCGEVLDIDGITGGFNFQSAWSTAWIVSENC